MPSVRPQMMVALFETYEAFAYNSGRTAEMTNDQRDSPTK
jgi:hypothetical protein